jgi:hypothetical protein
MRFVKPVSLLLGTVLLTGCVLTKMVTVPMRVAGAGVSIIPVAGNVAQVVIDEAAEGVDKLPF